MGIFRPNFCSEFMMTDTLSGFSTEAQTPLLASIIGFDLEAFSDAIVGRLQRLMREINATDLSSDTVGQVIRALLSYEGWHSNRVWASIPRLATVADIGERTVRRVLKWLKSILVIRDVTGEELYLGPGAHEFPRDQRKGETGLDSNCYDLSGLIPLLPEKLHRVLELILAGDFRPLSAARPAPPLAKVEDLFPDPFAENPESPETVEVEKVEASPVSPFLHEQTKQAHTSTCSDPNPDSQCLVLPKNEPNGEKKQRQEAGKAGNRMARPELAYRKQDAEPSEPPLPAPTPPKTDRSYFAPGEETTAYQGMRLQKIGHAVAKQILVDKGPQWVNTLLAYGRWTRRTKAIGPAYLVATWQQHDGSWPDPFLEWYAKEKAAGKRIMSAKTPIKPPKPKLKAATVQQVQRFIAPSLAANKSLLEALSAAERADLESRARKQLHSEMGAAPARPLIRARMLAILKGESEGVPQEKRL